MVRTITRQMMIQGQLLERDEKTVGLAPEGVTEGSDEEAGML